METPAIVTEVLALELPLGQYVVIGSGTLSAYGIRKHNDIDLHGFLKERVSEAEHRQAKSLSSDERTLKEYSLSLSNNLV